MSDPLIKCAKRNCGFICYEHQWKLVPDPDFHGAKKATCPQCGNDDYYLAKAGEVQKAKSGVQLIEIERLRQLNVEGFDSKRDDKYTDGELIKAAESYLVAVTTPDEEGGEDGKSRPAWDWPWAKSWWKPSNDPIRNLVKAGALIAAEIDRLQRATKQTK